MIQRISPTLLDSFAYFMANDYPDAREQMLARIRGTGETTPAMQAGIDFEDAVVSCAAGVYDGEDEAVIEVASLLKGGLWQQHVSCEIGKVMLHGYVDAIKGPTAYDIKTTGKYVEGKYLHNNQHRAYLMCLQSQQIERFVYVINCKGAIYHEEYSWLPSFETDLQSAIADFYGYLSLDSEMNEAWLAKQERDSAEG